MVEVTDKRSGVVTHWGLDKFRRRLEEMREMLSNPPHNPIPASKDPFHERLPWFHMVGRASVSLNNLLYGQCHNIHSSLESQTLLKCKWNTIPQMQLFCPSEIFCQIINCLFRFLSYWKESGWLATPLLSRYPDGALSEGVRSSGVYTRLPEGSSSGDARREEEQLYSVPCWVQGVWYWRGVCLQTEGGLKPFLTYSTPSTDFRIWKLIYPSFCSNNHGIWNFDGANFML